MGAVFESRCPPSASRYEVYVYDTDRVTSEYDDPLSAVLFHYPRQLTQEHILLTSGQLAGIAHFFSATLGEEAKFFQLEKGRYEIDRSGRFLLFVGDTTIRSLDQKSNGPIKDVEDLKKEILGLVRFFFGSFEDWFEDNEVANGKGCFCNPVTELLGAFFAKVHKVPFLITNYNVALCREIVKACHEHEEVFGCLVAKKGETWHTTFPTDVSRWLTLVQHCKCFIPSEVRFRLPVSVQLFQLGDDLDLPVPEVEEDDDDSDEHHKSDRSSTSSEHLNYDRHSGQKGKTTQQRKSVRKRNQIAAKKRMKDVKHRRDLVDLVRKACFTSNYKTLPHANCTWENHLLVQELGDMRLIVGIKSRCLHEALVRDIWNIGINKLLRN